MHFSSPGRRNQNACAGFTLVELLISIAIVGIINGIVLVKYNSFDSVVLLKDVAYEIALSLREAQVKSISVVGSNGEFDYPYGLTFTPDTQEYTVFKYKDTDPDNRPQYDVLGDDPDVAENIQTIPLDRKIKIQDVCISTDNSDYTCTDIDRLDVSFRRPQFKPLFYATGANAPVAAEMASILSAQIKVQTMNGGNIFVITISGLGQISVAKE